MRNIQAFDMSARLQHIATKAQLSNASSRDALAAAVQHWEHYASRYDHARTSAMLPAVHQHITHIITQVNTRMTRINPLVWRDLHQVDALLKYAIANHVNLSPNPFPTDAANDDTAPADAVEVCHA